MRNDIREWGRFNDRERGGERENVCKMPSRNSSGRISRT